MEELLKPTKFKHIASQVLHYCLFRYAIPVELRYIIKRYLLHQFNNESLKIAVDRWCGDTILKELICFYGHISDWDTSHVTDMSLLFAKQTKFDDDISQWDVSQVTNMSKMFCMTSDAKSRWSNYKFSKFNKPFIGMSVMLLI